MFNRTALEKVGAKSGLDVNAASRRRSNQHVRLRDENRRTALIEHRNRGTETALPTDAANPMAYSETVNPDLIGVELVPRIASEWEHNPPAARQCCLLTQMICCRKNPLLDAVVENGLVGKLVTVLEGADAELAYLALQALTGLCQGTTRHRIAVAAAGGAVQLVRYLGAPNPAWRSIAARAIGYLGAESKELRDQLFSHGVLQGLYNILQAPVTPDAVQCAIAAFAALVKHKPFPSLGHVQNFLAYLRAALDHHDEAVISESLWALSYISDGEDRIAGVLAANVLPRTTDLLASTNPEISLPAVRLVGNFCQGSDDALDEVLRSGAMRHVPGLLNHENSKVRKEVAWMLSNIAAGSTDQVNWLYSSNLLPELVPHLSESQITVRRECMWTFTNLVETASYEQAIYLLRIGFLTPYAQLLRDADMKMVEIVIKGLTYLVQVGEKVAGRSRENPFRELLTKEGIVQQVEELECVGCLQVRREAEEFLYIGNYRPTHFDDWKDDWDEQDDLFVE